MTRNRHDSSGKCECCQYVCMSTAAFSVSCTPPFSARVQYPMCKFKRNRVDILCKLCSNSYVSIKEEYYVVIKQKSTVSINDGALEIMKLINTRCGGTS